MRRTKYYISTIAEDSASVAKQYGFGLEIAEYCTAYNMDDYFEDTNRSVQKKLEGIQKRLLHAPFNELFPCAIDPKARQLAACRFRQAVERAQTYGAEKVIIHGGYNPMMYFPVWYVEQSIPFWKAFLRELPDGITICLENVLEEVPELLLDVVKRVADPRLRLCLDIGHVNAYSKVPVLDWLEISAPYISHFHIHNNDGSRDAHAALYEGSLPMREFLKRMDCLCPDATVTLELMQAGNSVRWLLEE